ncbi:hypothetical protein VB264_22825 [Arcicella aquatica]|uniref:Uncharacterized protein n=1 Tax=Arcicella aquatica TaxID=217141 RepID=A0ABU5QVB6_9BACT|nr:hypothetical protein [Arcicella aquatica]MEA5260650.1 hypothetical protein [Arcicella aquatica]
MKTPYEINCICEHHYVRFMENGMIQHEKFKAHVIEQCRIVLIDPKKSKERLATETLALNQKIKDTASKVFERWIANYHQRKGHHDWRLYNRMLNLK